MPNAVKIVLVAVVAIAAVFCAGSYALDRHLLGQTYARQPAGAPTLMLTDADIASEYAIEDVSFELNGATLRGHVYRTAGSAEHIESGESGEPATSDEPSEFSEPAASAASPASVDLAAPARGLVILRHGIFSQHQDYLAFVTALVDRGWTVFAYDALGCGESDGDTVIGFAQSPLDVRAAVRFADESGMADGLPVVLLGHSWGGYGVAGALDFEDVRDRVAACVTLSGFDAPMGIIMESAEGQMGPVARTQEPFIDLIGRLDFGEDANRSAVRAVSDCGLPVLVVHGTGDAVISYDGASIIAHRDAIDRANPQVSYLTMDEEGRNGHNTYFYAPESQAYLTECAAHLAELPADEQAAYLATVDKRRANTADPDLVARIDAFFSDAIQL